MGHDRSAGLLSRWAFAVMLAPLIAFVLFQANTQAQTTSDSIWACVQKASQQVRLVAPGEACRPTETPVQWNLKGPKGDTGATGAQGPKGDTGAAGAGLDAGSITGRLVECSSAVIAGGMVMIPGQSYVAFSDGQGAFKLSYVAAGNWDLWVGQGLPTVPVTVNAGLTTPLSDVIVTPLNTKANCGFCGNACTGLASCVNGVCVVPICAAGQAYCGGQCVDTGSDPLNCGGCNQVCPGSPLPGVVAACVNSMCTSRCAPGFLDCDGDGTNGCETQGLACDGLPACSSDSDCYGWHYCRLTDHTCVAKQANGSVCAADNQCMSAKCSSGYCSAQ